MNRPASTSSRRASPHFGRYSYPAPLSSGVNGCRTLAGTSWPNRKHVTDAHRALIPTCRHSLKVRSGWRHSSCKIRTISLSLSLSLWLFRCLSCTTNEWLHRTHQFCRQFDNNFIKHRGDIRHFVPGWPNIAGDALTPMPLRVYRGWVG